MGYDNINYMERIVMREKGLLSYINYMIINNIYLFIYGVDGLEHPNIFII